MALKSERGVFRGVERRGEFWGKYLAMLDQPRSLRRV
jgi:hypothetical protein